MAGDVAKDVFVGEVASRLGKGHDAAPQLPELCPGQLEVAIQPDGEG